jgi:hypothetical protein
VGILVEMVPFEFAASEHMKVQMGDLLPTILTVVGDQTITGPVESEGAGKLLRKGRQSGHGLRINILKTGYVFFGDDEDVDGGFGIEIMKRKKIIVFQYGVVGNVP